MSLCEFKYYKFIPSLDYFYLVYYFLLNAKTAKYLIYISKTDNFVMASQGLILQMSFTTKLVYHILAAIDILLAIL